MMDNQQLINFLTEVNAVFQKHGVNNRTFKFKGQEDIESKILHVKNNPASYDPKTYGNPTIYAEFLERNKDRKFVFFHISPARKNWKINSNDIIKEYDLGNFSAPDFCPDSGCMLDYCFGRNAVTSNPEFRPSFEHIITRNEIAIKGLNIEHNDISNLEIISEASNIYRSKGTFINRLQLFQSSLNEYLLDKSIK